MYPEDRRYTKEHEWIRLEGEVARVGITAHAQEQLGDVVFVELPDVGRRIAEGESFGTVESVKAVSELFSPAAGEVAETNPALADKPESINADPHGEAWMITLKLDDPGILDRLMDAAGYQKFVEEESK